MAMPEYMPMTFADDRARPAVEVVVVGAASRDIAPDDPRGWRLGGWVTYSALTTARLGLRTAALIGLDDDAEDAHELDLLRAAGVEIRTHHLERGPVFDNIERPEGRLQIAHSASDWLPPEAVPAEWRGVGGWILAPVAAELADRWATLPPSEAIVAVGWQGLLRLLTAGAEVRHVPPGPTPILARADLVGVSRDDLDRQIELADLCRALRPGATLAVTQGSAGGVVVEVGPDGPVRMRHYPAAAPGPVVDPTGAGDVFLAALAASRMLPQLVGGRLAQGFDLLLAAAAASLVLEAPGLHGVADRETVRRRMAETLGRERAARA
jgi:sugar/nucleoside kinase (ribokinase family)